MSCLHPQGQSVEIAFLDLIYKTRKNRQLYINHGTVLKATLQREAADDFENADPMTVLMECIGKRISAHPFFCINTLKVKWHFFF